MSEQQSSSPDSKALYTAESIKVYEGLEAVRVRPGMYVGDVRDGSGLYQLVMTAVESALYRGRNEPRVAVDLVLHPDGSISIGDDAPPFGVEPGRRGYRDDYSDVELLLSVIYGGCVRDDMLYALNALSRTLDLEVFHRGDRYLARFERGARTQRLAPVGRTDRRGTVLHMLPDDAIFQGVTRYSAHALAGRLRPLAASTPKVRITVTDRAADVSLALHYPRGMADWLEEIEAGAPALFRGLIHARGGRVAGEDARDWQGRKVAHAWLVAVDNRVELAVRGLAGPRGLTVRGVVNGLEVPRGAHVGGFRDGLRGLLGRYANVTGESVEQCPLSAVVSLTAVRPMFTRQTREEVSNPEFHALVARAVTRELGAFLDANPSIARQLAERAAAEPRRPVATPAE